MSFLALPIESDDSYTAPCSLQPVPQPSTSYCQLHQHPSATKVPLPAPAHNNLFLPKRSLYASRNGIKSAGPSNNASQDIPDIMAFTPQERLHALQTEREQLRPEQNLRAAQIDRSIEAIHLQMRTPVPHPAFSRSLPAPRTRPLFASQAMPPVGRTMRLSQDDVALLDKQQQEWEQSHPTIPDSPVKRTHGRAQSRGALFATLGLTDIPDARSALLPPTSAATASAKPSWWNDAMEDNQESHQSLSSNLMTEEDNNQDFDNSDESYCWMPRTDSQDLNPPEWLEDGSTMLRIYEDAKVGHS